MTINNYAKFVIKNLGANIKIDYNRSMTDGTPRKILDCSVAKKYGWKPKYNLKKGFDKTYEDYIKNINNGRNK